MKPTLLSLMIAFGALTSLAWGQDGASARAPWFSSSAVETTSGRSLPNTIRVGIVLKARSVSIGCAEAYSYVALRGGRVHRKKPNTRLKIKATKKGLLAENQGFHSSLLIAPALPNSVLTVDGKRYRGFLIVKPRPDQRLDVIEQVSLEEYLYGVLPREVSPEWPLEALKAQAVVSRTYMVANQGKYSAKGYDLTGDVFSQAYGGLDIEAPAANQAVDATRGEILVDRDGAPIQAFFHSSCGGRTESPSYVWRDMKDPPDYLESARDGYCEEDPYFHWQTDLSAASLARRLRKAGYKTDSITKIKIAKRSPSGRAWTLAVDTPDGKVTIQAYRFRMAVGADILRSTFLTEIQRHRKTFHFEGRGWGHGVGLCQWGARGRAQAGHSYEKILKAYYPHTRLMCVVGESNK